LLHLLFITTRSNCHVLSTISLPTWLGSSLKIHLERGLNKCLPIYAEFKNNKPYKQSPNIKKEINQSTQVIW
jgi:hypothetical protein